MSSQWKSARVLAAVAALVAAGLAAASPATAKADANSTALSRAAGPAISTPMQVQTGQAQLLGAASADQQLRLTIGLKTPHPAEEDAFVASLKDKSSPNFRHFLTAAQWNARFAPSAASQQAVVDWAKSQGLTVTKVYPNHLVVDLDGTVGAVQKALGVTIDNYRLGATSFYSNDRSVSLPSGISSIVESVAGLNSLQQLKPASVQSERSFPAYSAGPVLQVGASGHANGSRKLLAKAMAASKRKLARTKSGVEPQVTGGAYDPTDMYSDQAYSVDALNAMGHCCNPTHAASVTPPATSIAIATAGAHSATDFSGFQAQYSYLAYHYQEFNIDGTPACCDKEGTLDFEWSMAMANSFGSFVDTAMVYLYDGANAQLGTFTDIWNQMLTDGKARTMSSSWGCAESYCYTAGTMNTDHAIFDSMVGQGWTLMSASDDKGAYADCSHVSISYPASDPDVLSAGGTDLSLSGGAWSSETAWIGATGAGSCGSNGGGGGGGCSVQWALPSYQSGRIQSLCSNRAEPDFSLNAGIGQNLYYSGGFQGSGGTSIVSPELAGIWAQINAYLGSFPSAACTSGCTTVGQANPDVYSAQTGIHHPYYDITSGCTSNDAGTGYCGITGYDRATGLGSANLFQLAMQVLWYNVIEAAPPTVTMSGPTTNVYQGSGTVSWSIVDNGTGAPTGVAGYTAAWDSDPGNPQSETHGGSGNYFWDGPSVKNATSGSLSLTSVPSEGCHTLYVRAWDNIGESSVNSYGPVCFDGTAPIVTTPTVSMTKDSVLTASGALPVKVTWSGSDALTGIAGFHLMKSVNAGAFTPVSLPSPTATSATVNLTPGKSYKFEVSATDGANNTSDFTGSDVHAYKLFEETNSAIAYSAKGWTLHSSTSAVGGKVKFATAAGKKAKFSFTGSQVGWVTLKSAGRGKATVKLGSASSTVNTHLSSAVLRDLAFVGTVTGTGSHTLVVTNKGTSGSPRIDIDAFVVLT